jgi:arylsulfatase A-like enzyme
MSFKINKLPLFTLGLATVGLQLQAQTKRPNIIFILSDDHAKPGISAYNGIFKDIATTPNIDKIAKEGAIFQNFFCTNSISGPSRACLITGKYSNMHGMYLNEGGIVFDNTQPTTATILKANGYNTALVGKWHLMSTPVGFDYYKIMTNSNQQGTYWNPVYSENGKEIAEKGYESTLTTKAAMQWLESVKSDSKPFMLMLHFKAPHRPWEPDSCYQHLWENQDLPYPASFNDDYSTREKTAGHAMARIDKHLSRNDLKQTPPAGLTGKERENWLWYGGSGDNQQWTPGENLQGQALRNWKYQIYIKNYLRTIRSVDDNVGRVLDYLKANGLDENTIVVYMGDQGFFLGEHGWYDKRWMYEESFQMPCLIRYPKAVKAGISIKSFGTNVDITPTLLEYAGVKIPSNIQGKSLKPLLEQQKNATKNWRKSVYYQYFEYPKWHRVLPHYGLRTERYKLIHFYYTEDMWEFYDLKKDPNELKNQYANPEYKNIIAKLKKELYKQQKAVGDNYPLEVRKKMTDKFSIQYEH